ncbi:DUF2325 domain-containing protein [Proteinivorax tanatarense]|uniref:DUF2325 domain-containing protein n=1 Tax=Proteinivorax tanatarense TaxID=1260629 RepID=A0AAU7VNF7_9FIRM
MCVYIVGGDRVESINKNLKSLGATKIMHVDGRKTRFKKNSHIPTKADLVVVLTDFINHNSSSAFKKEAKERSIPIVFSKRSWACLSCKVQPILSSN